MLRPDEEIGLLLRSIKALAGTELGGGHAVCRAPEKAGVLW